MFQFQSGSILPVKDGSASVTILKRKHSNSYSSTNKTKAKQNT